MIERLPLPSARTLPGTIWLMASKMASTSAWMVGL